MYLLATFGGYKSHRNRVINSYINSYMDALEKAELIASCEMYKIKKTDLQFWNPGYDWQKNKKKEKNIGNYKALWVLRKYKK